MLRSSARTIGAHCCVCSHLPLSKSHTHTHTHTHTFCAGICVHAQRSVRDALTKAVQSTVDVVRFFTVPSLKSGARGTWEGAQVRV